MSLADELLRATSAITNAATHVDLVATMADVADALALECALFVYRFKAPGEKPRFTQLMYVETASDALEPEPSESIAEVPWVRYALSSTAAAWGTAEHEDDGHTAERIVRDADPPAALELVVPAPSSVNDAHTGGLYVAWPASAARGVDRVAALVSVRSLAMTLLEWHIERERSIFLQRTGIKPAERQLLNMADDGLPSKVIARRMSTSAGSIDSRFHRINRRFGTRDRRVSAQLARVHGLL